MGNEIKFIPAGATLPNGYTMITTFDMDFAIADRFGAAAVQDTYNRAFEGWKDSIEYITELVLVLNFRCWDHYGKDNELSELYSNLYYQLRAWVYDNKTGEDIAYFFRTTD